MSIIKKIGVTESGSTTINDIGSEAQNVDISYDSSGNVIEDITSPSASVNSTKSVAKAIKDIDNTLEGKINISELAFGLPNGYADRQGQYIPASELPSFVDDIVEGYYKEADGKFYEENTYTTLIIAEVGKIYLDLSTNSLYRYDEDQSKYIGILGSSNNINLNDLSDVNINNETDGELLTYNSTTNKWTNEKASNYLIKKPLLQGRDFVYNGSSQGPTITNIDPNFDTYVETTGNLTEQDAGRYTIRFSIKNKILNAWEDFTTADIEFEYTINKANGNVTFSPASPITLTNNQTTQEVTLSNNTGAVTVSSSNTGIATVSSIANNKFTITGVDAGTTTVTLNVAASKNYNSATKTITVNCNFAQLVGWSTGTDKQITDMVNAYYNGTFTLDQIQQVWHVGESRTVHLSAMSATGVSESHREQDVEMVILDFDHDTLTTSTGGKIKALVTLGQKDCLRDATVTDEQGSSNTENGYMNSSNTNVGGWTSCARRAWCNNGYYNALPNYLKNLVKPVDKLTSAGNQSTTINTDSDKVFLPSEIEIFGTTSYSAVGEGTQYSYYTTASNRYKLPKWNSSDVSGYWWERSPATINTVHFCRVYGDGNAYGRDASSANGIAPSYCI